jgi:hypothetical protein
MNLEIQRLRISKFYLKESRCHEETVRLLRKFDTRGKFDTNLIENHWNPRPNRRFCEILIFICQFFGRAEHVMEDSKVRQLWSTLVFVNDFIKALEDQSKEYYEKQEKWQEITRNEDEKKRKEMEDILPHSVSEQGLNVDVHVKVDSSKQKAIKKRKTSDKKAAAKKNTKKKGKSTTAESTKEKEATKSAVSVVSVENMMCFSLLLLELNLLMIFFCAYIMVETLQANKFISATEYSAHNRFSMWINSVPTDDDVAKLIVSKERMKVFYEDLVKKKDGELV